MHEDEGHKRAMAFFTDAQSHYSDQERELLKFDSGWAKAALYFRTGEHFGHPEGSRRMQGLLEIREQLNVFKGRLDKGETMAILHAISLCAEENLPLPTWLAIAYRTAFVAFIQVGGKQSLDDVFRSTGLPTETPKKAAAARQDWQLGVALYREAWRLAHTNDAIQSLDAALTEVLSKNRFGVGKTKARSLLLMVEKNQLELLGDNENQGLSRFFEKRRKG